MQIETRSTIKLSVWQSSRGCIYRRYIKRPMDLFFSLFAIIILSPALLIISILVRIVLGSPIIFKQNRPGLNERIFTLFKFRTMTNMRDEKGELLPDKDRLTKFGKLLRSTSLDELPELFNILNGSMSIIGPRPLLVQYLPLYNSHQKRRHEARPGLSGLAQINGRNSINWEDRFNLDVQYVDNITFTGDMRIIFLTIWKTLKSEGINQEGEATMKIFTGSSKNEDYSNV